MCIPLPQNEVCILSIYSQQLRILKLNLKTLIFNRNNLSPLFTSVHVQFATRQYILHCVKRVRIRSYSGPYFPEFVLNTDQNNFLRSAIYEFLNLKLKI